MKKNIILIALLFSIVESGFSQNLDSLLKQINLSKEWKFTLISDTSYLPIMEQKPFAKLTFESKENMVVYTIYRIINESKLDSNALKYHMLSSCFLHQPVGQIGLTNFKYNNNFFLLNMCPKCYNNELCTDFAKKIFNLTLE